MISERISDGISDDIPSHSYALLSFCLKLECCKPRIAARHPMKCDVINDVKLFPTVYRRIYCRNLFTLSNQTLHYKINCIRIMKLLDWLEIGS